MGLEMQKVQRELNGLVNEVTQKVVDAYMALPPLPDGWAYKGEIESVTSNDGLANSFKYRWVPTRTDGL